jgi:hypothetical protein
VFQCFGNTVCSACAAEAKSINLCPIEKRDVQIHAVTNRAIERLVKVVTERKQDFIFDAVNVAEDFFHIPAREVLAAAAEVEVMDVDEFEPEVFDVDNPRPLTAKEIEQLERRERRKKKAIEILMKREGRMVKGELSEADINKLLKTELKAELGFDPLTGAGVTEDQSARTRPVVLEFPKLLTREEFSRWQQQPWNSSAPATR